VPEQLRSPVSLPASFLSEVHQIPALVLMTGESGAGKTAGLALLDSRRYRLACIVVRPSLLHLAQARWPWSETMQIASGGPA
jgi:hypothetical protein